MPEPLFDPNTIHAVKAGMMMQGYKELVIVAQPFDDDEDPEIVCLSVQPPNDPPPAKGCARGLLRRALARMADGPTLSDVYGPEGGPLVG